MAKIQDILELYYSRKDIQNVIFEFCKDRETVPRYGEGFGKRPDILDFPTDIINFVRKGATSFHCSEELWKAPLQLSTSLSQKETNDLRKGWDLLIDIDSKYFDYSKIACILIMKVLEYHGVKNFGIKFSGSKGLHLIIPWKAFPSEIDGIKTAEQFPEWPRLIASYIQELIKDDLTKEILKHTPKSVLESSGKTISEIFCMKCDKPAEKKSVSLFRCRKCKTEMQNFVSKKESLKCLNPGCKGEMIKIRDEEIISCTFCKSNSLKNPENFEERQSVKELIESVDLVLVAPRHLFRCPYSLHEKTALSSAVLEKEEIPSFLPQQADPLKVKIRNFYPSCREGEARELLLQALDWEKRKMQKEKKVFTGKSIDIKNLTIKESHFPPCIQEILKGMKSDGRKRALFILLAFFSSLNFPQDLIEQKISEWNKKNSVPLKEGYIRSQIAWSTQNKILPPNCNSHYYRDIGIKCICNDVKNPVPYTIKQAFKDKNKENFGKGTKFAKKKGDYN
jgi:hypothetical protein